MLGTHMCFLGADAQLCCVCPVCMTDIRRKLSSFLQIGIRDMGITGDFCNTAKKGAMEEKRQPLYLGLLEMPWCPLMNRVPVQFVWMWLLSEQTRLS